MDDLNPTQRQAIQSWTEKRDAIVKEIGAVSIELEQKQKECTAFGLALSDLHTNIAEARGRLAELIALEERHKTSVSTEIVELESRKSQLEIECKIQQEELDAAKREKKEVITATETLSKANDEIKQQIQAVKSLVDDLIITSKDAFSGVKISVSEIRSIADEVISKGNENVKQTQIVIDKLPKFIFESQKPIPVRRTYRPGHPNAVATAPDLSNHVN